ncbi:MAG TPA: invasin domain 3-containing protein [Anaerolineae bacterium]|nr:invasin domain 3-containing protein [Anaerolineae bacterium]
MGLPLPQLEGLGPRLRRSLRWDGKKRFVLLLASFNALLIVILLFSVRNSEIRVHIQRARIYMTHLLERIQTVQMRQVRVVYITATPLGESIAFATGTSTPEAAQQTATPRPSPTPLQTATPTRQAQPSLTNTPGIAATPTSTPTGSPSPTGTATPTPTTTSTPTALVTATATSTSTPTPTALPSPTATSTAAPTPTPVVYTLQLSAAPPELVADGTSSSTITAVVRYAGGGGAPDGTQVRFTTNRGTFAGGTSIVTVTHNGVATARLTSTSIGSATVTAVVGSVTRTTQVTFMAGAPVEIVLAAAPTDVPANGSALITLQATVTDGRGNPVENGTTVGFATTLGTLSATSAGTSNGVASVTLVSTFAGQATVTATSGTVQRSVVVRFRPVIQIAKSVNPVTAPGGSTVTYEIRAINATTGGAPASLQTLVDTLPAGFAYVPGSTTSPAFGLDPTVSGQQLTWTAPAPYDLAAGGAVVTTFDVAALAPAGTYANAARIEGTNFDPVSVGPAAQVTLLSPILGPMLPVTGCFGIDVPVRVNGTNFVPGSRAQLGAWDLAATYVNQNRLDGTVPQGIAIGVYDLTVTNPGGAASTLAGAFTVEDCAPAASTLESGFLATVGRELLFTARQGDDDSLQELFIEVPGSAPGPIYIRVFDPDCGGTLDMQAGLHWNTPFTFVVAGSAPAPLATKTFTEDLSTDASWYSFGPFAVSDGEPRADRRVFELSVFGGPEPPFEENALEADTNLYNVIVTLGDSVTTPVPGSRVFAYSWTFLIPEAEWATPPHVFPWVDVRVNTVVQHNFDYDNDTFGPGAAGLALQTPHRTLSGEDGDVSGDGDERSSGYDRIPGEQNTTWGVRCWSEPTGSGPLTSITDNVVTFWATDQTGRRLVTFARSTNRPPKEAH